MEYNKKDLFTVFIFDRILNVARISKTQTDKHFSKITGLVEYSLRSDE